MTQIPKKILFQLPVLLKPIDTGAKRRIVGFLEYFKSRTSHFQVDLLVRNDWKKNIWNLEQQQEALRYADRIFISRGESNIIDFLYSRSKSFYYQKILRQQLPIDTDYHTPPNYIRFLRTVKQKRKYDYFWINYLDYAHLAVQQSNDDTCKIIDMQDLSCDLRLARKDIPHLKGLKFNYETNFLKEVSLLARFDSIIANSLSELEKVKNYICDRKIQFIPHLIENSTLNIENYFSRDFNYDLLFVGADYQPNLTGIKFFLSEILPKLIELKPKIKLAIAGTVGRGVQLEPSQEKNVDILGYVPSLSAIYLASRIVICPLLEGSGTKVKLQEAMAYGLPIVTTTTGASGLLLQDGLNAFITDDPDLYARRILELLERSQLTQQMSQAVSKTYAEHYSHSAIYSQLDRLFGISPADI